MLNIGGGEIALILIVALLLLGPTRLPELARGLGKFLRELRRQTDDVRTLVEREFYKMEQDIQPLAPAKAISPNTANMAVPRPTVAPSNGTPAAAPAAPAAAGSTPDAGATPPATGPVDPSPQKAG